LQKSFDIEGLIEYKNQLIVLINLAKYLSVEDLVYIEKTAA